MLEARNKIRLMLPTPHSHLALKVFEKKRADCQFRTRNVSTEALGENHGSTAPSSRWPLANLIIMKIMRMAESVLSLTIYDTLIFSGRLKIRKF